jgi:acyl carrier protein
LNGGRLVLMVPGVPALEDLGQLLRAEKVTTLWLTAGLFQLMVEQRLEDLLGLRQLLAGGDVLAVPQVQQFLERSGGGTKLINGYGPTENTTFTCCHELRLEEVQQTAPIGRAIANTRVYLLNEDLEPVPVGVNGELYISGDGLARCYLQRPELTAEKFMPNPYGGAGERMYRSGDTARYRSDGVLEFVGRTDQQVKVRGFRIELGEIEAVLGSHPQVQTAAVVARRTASGEPRVVGYVVAAGAVRAATLRQYLRGKLPEYMVPGAIVLLAELPLTANGKVDRRALPEPETGDGEREYVKPATEMEELVAGVWQQVLGLERVGLHDNFFDLGGHSLLATQVISRLRQTSGVDIPMGNIFDTPTIADLAEYITAAINEASNLTSSVPIERVSREQSTPLSFEQQRLWFLDQLLPGNQFYNVPVAYHVTGQLNVKALESSLNQIITRHEVLRTTFPIIDGLPTQQVQPFIPLRLELVHLASGAANGEAELDSLVRAEGQRPFNLASGPVMRAKLFQVSDRAHVLVVTIHHIATDGWSMELLSSELAELYEAYSQGVEPALPELPVQYADYSAWQRRVVASEGVNRQLEYWKEQLAGAPTTLNLPTDHRRPEMFSFRGAYQRLEIDEDLFKKLEELGRQHGVTTFMTLLAAFATMLARYSGQYDILIGVPIANRTQMEFERLIGFFTNMIVLRMDLSGNPRFSELLRHVREKFLAAYAHKDVPFERLVEEIHPQRDLTSNPLFQVAFSLQNRLRRTFHLTDISLAPSNVDIETSKFDLCLYLFPFEHSADGFLGYNRDLFRAGTMEKMVQHFAILLKSIARAADERLSELEMLLDNEKALLSKTSVVEDFEESFTL